MPWSNAKPLLPRYNLAVISYTTLPTVLVRYLYLVFANDFVGKLAIKLFWSIDISKKFICILVGVGCLVVNYDGTGRMLISTLVHILIPYMNSVIKYVCWNGYNIGEKMESWTTLKNLKNNQWFYLHIWWTQSIIRSDH